MKKSIFTSKEKKLNQEFYEGLNLFKIGEEDDMNYNLEENIHKKNKDKIEMMYNKDLNNNSLDLE